jgi:hypothetical protein
MTKNMVDIIKPLIAGEKEAILGNAGQKAVKAA